MEGIDYTPRPEYNDLMIIGKVAGVWNECFPAWSVIKDASEKWELGLRRINTLCNEGRIEGATKIGNMWVIPENTERPKDERIKSGKYIK